MKRRLDMASREQLRKIAVYCDEYNMKEGENGGLKSATRLFHLKLKYQTF